jgi:hypothetical protein
MTTRTCVAAAPTAAWRNRTVGQAAATPRDRPVPDQPNWNLRPSIEKTGHR